MAEERPRPLDLSVLASLLAGWPYRVEGQWFYNQTLQLDGYHFVKCRFDACVLKTTKASFIFENCYMNGCSITYSGEAWKAIRLYNLISPGAFREAIQRWPSLTPIFNADGTFTIR